MRATLYLFISILLCVPQLAQAKKVSATICKGKPTYFIQADALPKTYAAAAQFDEYVNSLRDQYGNVAVTKNFETLLSNVYEQLIAEIPSIPPNAQNYFAANEELESHYNQIVLCFDELNIKAKDKAPINKQLEKYLFENVPALDELALSFLKEVNEPLIAAKKVALFKSILQSPEKNPKFLESKPAEKAKFEMHIELVEAQLDGFFASAEDKGYIPKGTKCYIANHEATALTNLEYREIYPPSALMADMAGSVTIEREIDETGKVTSAKFFHVSHPYFHYDPILKAAMETKYLPQFTDCRPVKSTYQAIMKFDLH